MACYGAGLTAVTWRRPQLSGLATRERSRARWHAPNCRAAGPEDHSGWQQLPISGILLENQRDRTNADPNISLTPEQDAFIDEVLEAGEYRNASEAMRVPSAATTARREALKLDRLRIASNSVAALDRGGTPRARSWTRISTSWSRTALDPASTRYRLSDVEGRHRRHPATSEAHGERRASLPGNASAALLRIAAAPAALDHHRAPGVRSSTSATAGRKAASVGRQAGACASIRHHWIVRVLHSAWIRPVSMRARFLNDDD